MTIGEVGESGWRSCITRWQARANLYSWKTMPCLSAGLAVCCQYTLHSGCRGTLYAQELGIHFEKNSLDPSKWFCE
jgi:hypothetical protein